MKKKGFTLVEIVAALLLMSVLLLSMFSALAPVSEGLALVRDNSDIAQKTHLSFARLFREFTTITEVVDSGLIYLTYDFIDPDGATQRHDLRWTGIPGDPLLLNGASLADRVQHFALRYYDRSGGGPASVWSLSSPVIAFEVQVQSGSLIYTNRVQPRNIN